MGIGIEALLEEGFVRGKSKQMAKNQNIPQALH